MADGFVVVFGFTLSVFMATAYPFRISNSNSSGPSFSLPFHPTNIHQPDISQALPILRKSISNFHSIPFNSLSLSLSLYPCLFLSVSPPFCLSPSRSINSLNSIRITLHYVSCPLRDNGKVRVSICQIANQIGWKCAPPHPPHPPPNGSSYFGRIRPAVKWHRHRIATLLIVSSA